MHTPYFFVGSVLLIFLLGLCCSFFCWVYVAHFSVGSVLLIFLLGLCCVFFLLCCSFFCFLCCVFFICLSSFCVLCEQCCLFFWMFYSWFSLNFSLTFKIKLFTTRVNRFITCICLDTWHKPNKAFDLSWWRCLNVLPSNLKNVV